MILEAAQENENKEYSLKFLTKNTIFKQDLVHWNKNIKNYGIA